MGLDPNSYDDEVNFVLDSQEEFPKQKKHNMLPIAFTSYMVRGVRQNACRQLGMQHCDVWQGGRRVVPIREYPCADCNSPAISRDNFSRAMWGMNEGAKGREEKRPVVGAREMRRMLNENGPIRPDRFRTMWVNAHALGWTRGWDFNLMLNISIRLEAASIAWRRMKVRIEKSARFKRTGQFDFDFDRLDADIAAEVGKIHRQIFKKATRRTDILLELQEAVDKCVADLEQIALMCEQMGNPDSAALIRGFIARGVAATKLPQQGS